LPRIRCSITINMNDIQLRALVLKVIKETVTDNPINCFANIAYSSDYNTDNLSKSFKEYESGEFWAREWEIGTNRANFKIFSD